MLFNIEASRPLHPPPSFYINIRGLICPWQAHFFFCVTRKFSCPRLHDTPQYAASHTPIVTQQFFMYKRKYKRRKYSRRSYKKRRNRVSKTVWKASKRAAKAQVYKMSETKRLHFVNNFVGVATGQSADLSAINPFQPFQNGTLQNTVVGNEIDVRYFELRYKLVHSAAAEKLISPIHFRVTLLKTPNVWPLGTPTLPYIPSTSIPNIFITGGVPLNNKLDSNQVKVLSQKTITLRPITGNTNSTNYYRFGKIKFRGLKGKKTFMSVFPSNINTSLGNIRQGQYYIMLQLIMAQNSTAADNVGLYYDWSMYYKDM